MWKTTSFRLFSYCLFDILYRQLKVIHQWQLQTENPFRAADVVLYFRDWWVQGGTLLATPTRRLQKTGHLIFPQLGSATPLRRVALLLLLVRTERQT
jgi:hypothetical protein